MAIDAVTERHLREQKLDLARRKRLERAKDKRERPSAQLHRTRIGDLNKIFEANYGVPGVLNYQFPDDDAGRMDAVILAQHYANGNPSAVARVLRARLPWMDEVEFQSLIADAYEDPRFWGAQELAHALQLTDKRRSDLKIKSIGSIDVSKRQRKKRRKVKDKDYQTAKRRAKGIKPRADYEAASLSNTKPWVAMNIRRHTRWQHRGMQVSQSAVKRFKAVSFSVGDEVSHQKFGDGEITEVNGHKLTVNFKRAGTKRVVDSFVTLCAKKSAEIIPFPAHRIVRRVEFGKVVSS